MIPNDILKVAITNGITKDLVDAAEKFGAELAKDDKDPKNPRYTLNGKLNPAQLRRFYGEVKRQQTMGFNKSEFAMLRPKLAYAVGKADKVDKLKISNLYECLSNAMNYVTDEKTFDNFVQVFESIVAYHKANS